MSVDAKTVAELRRSTGLPLMKCKKALVATDGDIDAAVENLRKEGLKGIDKLKGRNMKDGLVFRHIVPEGAAAVAVQCETDFVARAADFGKFGEDLVQAIWNGAPAASGDGKAIADLKLSDGRTVTEHLDELVGSKIRENMKVGDWACFKPDGGTAGGSEGGMVSTYVHHNGKIACLVELTGDGLTGHDKIAELGNDLGMQIAFHADVQAMTRDELDQEWVAKEREIFLAQVENMPEDKRAQIAEGKLSKRLRDVVLLEQPFIKNEKESVQKHIDTVANEAGVGVAMARFARIAAGI